MAKTKTGKPELDPRIIEVPLGEIPPAVYITRHVEVNLDHLQSCTLRRVFEGLDSSGARLVNGKRVASSSDVVRWLLEQVASG